MSANESRQDIDRQRRELRKLSIKDEHIYREYVSGSKDHKVELTKLTSVTDISPMDSISVTEVSRLTRSTKQLCEIIEFTRTKRIKLVIGSFTVDCTNELDPMTQVIHLYISLHFCGITKLLSPHAYYDKTYPPAVLFLF